MLSLLIFTFALSTIYSSFFRCAKSKGNRKYNDEKERNCGKSITKSPSSKGKTLIPLEIDFFPAPKKGVLKRYVFTCAFTVKHRSNLLQRKMYIKRILLINEKMYVVQ